MIRTLLMVLLLFVVSSPFLKANLVAEFDIYLSNPYVLIDEDHLCIWDQSLRKVYVFQRDSYKKIAEFGKQGQGPGEFLGINAVTMTESKIIVSSFPKLVFFSLKGEYIKEIKCNTDSGSFEPLGKNYLGRSYPYTNPKENIIKIRFSLYNSELEKIKDICTAGLRTQSGRRNYKKLALYFPGAVDARIYENRLYIGTNNEGFSINVYDIDGNYLYKIRKKLEKRKVTDEDIKYTIDELKEVFGEKEWRKLNALVEPVFPEYFADFENFAVADDKIYVFPYRQKDYRELLVYDLKGKLLARKKFPIIKGVTCITRDRFAICKSTFFYVDENTDEETWELHSIDLNNLVSLKRN